MTVLIVLLVVGGSGDDSDGDGACSVNGDMAGLQSLDMRENSSLNVYQVAEEMQWLDFINVSIMF